MDEQSRIAPQKPNRHSPRAGFSGGRWFRRHLLSRYSVRVEVRDGKARRLLICGSLGNCCGRRDIWLRPEKETKAPGTETKANGSPGRRHLDVPGRRRIQERSPVGRRWTSSYGSLPKNLIAAHPVQDSQAAEGSGGTCSPATPCAQRYGTGKAKGRLRYGLSEAKGENLD